MKCRCFCRRNLRTAFGRRAKRCRKLDRTQWGLKIPLICMGLSAHVQEHCGGGRRPLQGATDRFYVSPGFDMLQDLEVGLSHFRLC